MINLFTNPGTLIFLLAPFIAVLIILPRWKSFINAFGALVSPASLEKSDISLSGFRAAFLFRLGMRSVFYALAWIFLVIAAAGPRWGTRMESVRQNGSSVIFVLDISRSMTATDIYPTRLSFASRYASLLLDRLQGVPCGVVLSRGESVLSIPLTTDHLAVSVLLDSLSPALLSAPGSSIAQGVRTAISSFPQNSATSRTVIVLADGDGKLSDMTAAGSLARAEGVVVSVIGVGTLEGSPINVLPFATEAKIEQMILNDENLKALAAAASPGSLYVHALDSGSAWRVLDTISSSSFNSVPRMVQTIRPVERGGVFILAAFMCLSMALVLGGRLCKKKS